jgi:hypothetical protein
MWDQILGAMALLGMVVACAELPKLVDAWCEKIRGEAEGLPADSDEDGAEEVAAAAPSSAARTAAQPVTAKPAAHRPVTA